MSTSKSSKMERWIILFVVALVGGIITKLPYIKDSYYSALRAAMGLTNTGLAGIWYSFLPPYPYLVAIHAAFGITTVFTFWAAMVKITNNLGSGDEQGKMFGLLEGGRGLIGTVVALYRNDDRRCSVYYLYQRSCKIRSSRG